MRNSRRMHLSFNHVYRRLGEFRQSLGGIPMKKVEWTSLVSKKRLYAAVAYTRQRGIEFHRTNSPLERK